MPTSAYKVAYLGPEGTFSFFTAQEYAGKHLHAAHVDFIACADLPDVFEAVAKGQCHMGMVPLENSLRGTVGPSFDLFLQHTLRIRGEAFARISNTLLSNESSFASIKSVYSHPQPLAQCSKWLRDNLPGVPLIALESTAAAAKRAASEAGAAAVGHQNLAGIFGLNSLAHSIEDEDDNWTRFVSVTLPESTWPPQDILQEKDAARSSILFTLPDQPGALAKLLCMLAEHQVNMRKIESRPLLKKGSSHTGADWKYAFFVDVECDLTNPSRAGLLGEMTAYCTSIRLLGSYAAGPWLDIKNAQRHSHD